MSEEKENLGKEVDNQKKNWIRRTFLHSAFFFCFAFLIFFIYLFVTGYDFKKLLPVKHNIFVKGPDMHYFHNGPAVLLNDGNVLVIGGDTKHAEIYDSNKNMFRKTKDDLIFRRTFGASATLLPNGKVLIIGGANPSRPKEIKKNRKVVGLFYGTKGAHNIPVKEVEIFDPKTESFNYVGEINIPRYDHSVFVLNNEEVLIIGGGMPDIEEYDYIKNTAKIIDKLNISVSHCQKTLFLNDNSLFLWGDFHFNRLPKTYKCNINNFDCIKTNVLYSHCLGNANILENGDIIITGGVDGQTYTDTKKVTLIDKNFNITNKELNESRASHTMHKLNNGNLLIIGGYQGEYPFRRVLKSTELYDYKNKTFKLNSANLNEARAGHTSINLNNGNILIFGGNNSKNTEIYIF